MATATNATKPNNGAKCNKKNPRDNTAMRQQRSDPGLLRQPSRQLSQTDGIIHPAPPPEPRPNSRSARPHPLEIKRAPSGDSLGCSIPDITTPKDQLLQEDASPEHGPPVLRHATNRPLAHTQALAAAATAAKGRPPKPKVRLVEPPMPCNPYMVRVEDGARYSFQAAASCFKPEGYSRFMWDYHQEAELGHGNFSKVYRAVHRLTGVPFAIKTNRSPITTLQARNMWLNEMQALAAVQGHAHIVRLHDGWFESDPRSTGERVFIKTELCGESLGGLVRRRLQLSEQGALDLLRQMASALKRIHEVGMVHLDIKPDNIYAVLGRGLLGAGVLGTQHRVDNSSPTATNTAGIHGCVTGSGALYKLGDFGLAMMQGGKRVGASEGDCRYLAPEALRTRGFLATGLAERMDIFALGATTYELMRGAELPKSGPEYLDVRAGRIVLPGVDTRLVALLKRMMSADPTQRPTADQLTRSPLLTSGIGGGGGSPLRRQSTPVTMLSALHQPTVRCGVSVAHIAQRVAVAPGLAESPRGPPFPLGPHLLSAMRRSVSRTR
ncbi:hypothetical protein Vretimale_9794 [Volvox reticuliferus]|uniref:Protein kinase domain-containing protein n=1 Tax=Volvox reticuliferus TaxID=1737510 RepID=A0A8J4LP59_9CHLO|nr:hypothetical protein Vretimale_9794 [Volvox reticuliferus]